MKRRFLLLAIVAGLFSLVIALWPARSPLYFTVAYVGMSVNALIALLCVEKPLRWLATVALLFGLLGVFISLQSDARGRASIKNPSLMQPTGVPTWIQWNSNEGGNNHYYALTPSAADWVAAEKQAESWGGTLARIISSEEQTFIINAFLSGKFEHLPVWIGLVRRPFTEKLRRGLLKLGIDAKVPKRAEFQWVTGEDYRFTYWSRGEPNNIGSGENYVAMNWGYSANPPRGIKGDWNDTPLNGFGGFGGNTGGPYFGLMEFGPLPEPILTPSRWGLVTLAGLALAAGLAFMSAQMRSARLAQQ